MASDQVIRRRVTRRGIVVGGIFVVDRVKLLGRFPEQDTLPSILGESTSSGGLAYNVLVDLARLEVGVPLEAVGCAAKIAGTTGAGDAFAAGFLVGIHEGLP